MIALALILAAAPARAEPTLDAALALRSADRLDEASAMLRSLALEDDNPDVWTELGVTLAWEGAHTEALLALDRALELDGDHAGARSMRARVLGWAGDYAAAQEAWIALADEGGADAWAGLGGLELARGRRGPAELAFAEALALSPQHAEAQAGMESLDGLRRGELSAGVVGWQWKGQAVGLGGEAALRWRPRTATSVGLAWAQGSTRGLSPVSTGHRLELGVAQRAHRGTTLEAGLVAQAGASPWIGAPLQISEPLERLTLSAGWRPGWSATGTDQLLSAGVRVGATRWIQVRGLGWWDDGVLSATSAVASGGLELPRAHTVRADLGVTRDPQGWLTSGSVGWSSPIWREQGLGVRLEALTGHTQRVSAALTWRVRLP